VDCLRPIENQGGTVLHKCCGRGHWITVVVQVQQRARMVRRSGGFHQVLLSNTIYPVGKSALSSSTEKGVVLPSGNKGWV